jgi:hypothetical protein
VTEIFDDPPFERLLVSSEPIKVVFVGEPYVVVTKRGYAVAATILEARQRKRRTLLLGAKSIAEALEPLRKDNKDRLDGIEVWIWKDGDGQLAPYRLRA